LHATGAGRGSTVYSIPEVMRARENEMTRDEVAQILLTPARAGLLRCVNASYCDRKECDPDKPNKPNCWCVRVRTKVV
jgi:hypothetical protein